MAKIALNNRKATGGNTANRKPLTENQRHECESIAYQIFVDRGYQNGNDQEDWFKAESIVRSKSN